LFSAALKKKIGEESTGLFSRPTQEKMENKVRLGKCPADVVLESFSDINNRNHWVARGYKIDDGGLLIALKYTGNNPDVLRFLYQQGIEDLPIFVSSLTPPTAVTTAASGSQHPWWLPLPEVSEAELRRRYGACGRLRKEAECLKYPGECAWERYGDAWGCLPQHLCPARRVEKDCTSWTECEWDQPNSVCKYKGMPFPPTWRWYKEM
jgi:hypothetical protein